MAQNLAVPTNLQKAWSSVSGLCGHSQSQKKTDRKTNTHTNKKLNLKSKYKGCEHGSISKRLAIQVQIPGTRGNLRPCSDVGSRQNPWKHKVHLAWCRQ